MRRPRVLLIASISLASFPSVISAQTPVGPSVSLGGYIQTQYTRISMDGGDPRDRVLFRRIMLWAQSDLGEHWSAEVEADVAPATLGERILVRDAYLRYSGLRDGHFIVTLGNQKMPFSRSALTGASKRGFVERPVTGERPFGAPGARSR